MIVTFHINTFISANEVNATLNNDSFLRLLRFLGHVIPKIQIIDFRLFKDQQNPVTNPHIKLDICIITPAIYSNRDYKLVLASV